MAKAIGLSSSSFYARLNGKSMIQAHELSALALYFGVPVSFFYDPPEGLLGKAATVDDGAVSSVRLPRAA